jgi:hypothetical protein
MVLIDESGTSVGVIAGLLNASGVMGSDDAVNRESAKIRAVVASGIPELLRWAARLSAGLLTTYSLRNNKKLPWARRHPESM